MQYVEVNEGWMFSQEVLKVASHCYNEALDILKEKCSFSYYFYFYAWQN